MMRMIYGRAGAVKFFDAPEPRRAVQDASASFPRVWDSRSKGSAQTADFGPSARWRPVG